MRLLNTFNKIEKTFNFQLVSFLSPISFTTTPMSARVRISIQLCISKTNYVLSHAMTCLLVTKIEESRGLYILKLQR